MTPEELKRLRELVDLANHDCECGDCEWCEAKDELYDSVNTALPALLDEIERLQANSKSAEAMRVAGFTWLVYLEHHDNKKTTLQVIEHILRGEKP